MFSPTSWSRDRNRDSFHPLNLNLLNVNLPLSSSTPTFPAAPTPLSQTRRRRRPALTPSDSDCSSETEQYLGYPNEYNYSYDYDYDYTRADHLRFSAQRNTRALPSPEPNLCITPAPSPALTTRTLTLPTASADRLSVSAGEILILPAAPLVRLSVQICAGRRSAKTYRAAVVEGVRLRDVVRQLVGSGDAKVYVKTRGEWVEQGGGVRVSELTRGRRGEVEVRIVVGGTGGGVVWERETEVERERVYVY